MLSKTPDFTTHNLMSTLGMVFSLQSENEVEATMPVNEKTCQPFGLLNGGATIALAESLAGLGSLQLCDEHSMLPIGSHVSAHHLRSAKFGETVLAKGTLLHKGRTQHIWNVDVFVQGSGLLISTIRVTNSLISKK